MKLIYMKAIVIMLSVLLIACQHTPSFVVLSSGLNKTVINTTWHQHLLLMQPAIGEPKQLHVYIEGDGTPWESRKKIAQDPTPRYPLMLRLMRQDPHPSFYLGRPCYFNREEFGLSDQSCEPSLWTNKRYSEEMLVSLIDALRSALATQALPHKGITLIGHSGGGTLAILMAMRMPEVTQLVTVAANLDLEAWSDFHHFSPLIGSLNPTQVIKTATPKYQLHFAGGRDHQVPYEPVRDFLARIGQSLIIYPEQDHHNWSEVWSLVLQTVDSQENL
jgi:pimeloyl-ACP methyl ester carboxylesterase